MTKRIEIVVGADFAAAVAEKVRHPEKIGGKTTIYVDNFEQLKEVLSPERLRMLASLNFPDCEPPTINGLAKKLGRKRQSVARDLRVLEQRGLVGIERKGREAKAVAKAKEVLIRFR